MLAAIISIAPAGALSVATVSVMVTGSPVRITPGTTTSAYAPT
jgi:hypothetical protein